MKSRQEMSHTPQRINEAALSLARLSRHSSEQRFDHPAMDVRQPKISTFESKRESLMIDSQAMKKGRLEVVDVNRIFNHIVPEFIGPSVIQSGADTTSCHPDTETARMVVSSIFLASIVLAV